MKWTIIRSMTWKIKWYTHDIWQDILQDKWTEIWTWIWHVTYDESYSFLTKCVNNFIEKSLVFIWRTDISTIVCSLYTLQSWLDWVYLHTVWTVSIGYSSGSSSEEIAFEYPWLALTPWTLVSVDPKMTCKMTWLGFWHDMKYKTKWGIT